MSAAPSANVRPPLYLTASEARNWMSLHSEDVGREIVIVGSPIVECPPEYVEAFRGYGRWERGLAGQWPALTAFAVDVLARPPAWMRPDPRGVTLTLAGQTARYRFWSEATKRRRPTLVAMIGDDRRGASLERVR